VCNFTLRSQCRQRADALGKWHLRIGAVQLVERDALQTEPAKTFLAAESQLEGASVWKDLVSSRLLDTPFRGDHHGVRETSEGLTDQSLVPTRAVGVRGIDEIYPQFNRSPDKAFPCFPVGIRAEVTRLSAKAHGAIAKAPDRTVTAEEIGCLIHAVRILVILSERN